MPHLQWKGDDSGGFSDDGFRAKLKKLTPREWEILECLLAGDTAKEIALASGTSSNTIGNQRRNIFRKLEIESEIHLLWRCLSVWLGNEFALSNLICKNLCQPKNEA